MSMNQEEYDLGIAQNRISELESLLAKSHSENEEQARLLGMSGSREAKLLAEIDTLKKEIAKYRATLDTIRTKNGLQYSDIFNLCDKALGGAKE